MCQVIIYKCVCFAVTQNETSLKCSFNSPFEREWISQKVSFSVAMHCMMWQLHCFQRSYLGLEPWSWQVPCFWAAGSLISSLTGLPIQMVNSNGNVLSVTDFPLGFSAHTASVFTFSPPTEYTFISLSLRSQRHHVFFQPGPAELWPQLDLLISPSLQHFQCPIFITLRSSMINIPFQGWASILLFSNPPPLPVLFLEVPSVQTFILLGKYS